jgi:hypothetical protein
MLPSVMLAPELFDAGSQENVNEHVCYILSVGEGASLKFLQAAVEILCQYPPRSSSLSKKNMYP